MSAWLDDLRHAARGLRAAPRVSLAATLTLGLAVGANAVIFSAVQALLLRPLPYPDSGRLVALWRVGIHGEESGIPTGDALAWQEGSRTVERLAFLQSGERRLFEGDAAEPVSAAAVSRGFLPLLQGRPLLGRGFLEDDHRPGAEPVVLLSQYLWQARFGSDANVLGRRISLDGTPHIVVGVMPKAFQFPFRSELWTPLDESVLEPTHAVDVVALRRAGAGMDDCARELGTVVAGGSGRVTDKGAGWKVAAARLRDTLPGLKYRAPLVALQLAVAFVLLVASANLAHLVLARNESRRHELALRLALGARPLRLARQLLLESLLVGAAGGALGLGLAAVGMHVLRGQLARPGPSAVEATLDGTVLTVTLLVSLLTSAVFGVLPAVRAARMDPARELKRARGAAGARWGGLAATLVTAEVASAVVLLVAAGLMVRTLRNLALEDPGFRAPDAYSVRVSFPPLSPEALQARADGVIARLDALPGVEAAGAVAYPPLVGYNPGVDLALEGREAGATPHHVHLQFVSPGYFDALGIPLRRGRALAATDVSPHPESVLVNERLAAQLGPPNDVLGGRVRLADDRFPSSLRVVGVVGDVQQFGPGSGVRPEVYVPAYYRSQLTYVVRTRAGTGGLVPALAQAVHREGLAAGPPRAMTQALFDFLQVRRVLAGLLGTLAVVSLLLAASGISSVVAYGVSRRTREIGIRMALGARAIDARRMVLGETLRRSLAGTVLGLAGAWAVSRGLRRMLFGVTPSDPVTLAFVITLLVAVALLASYWPARRASRVDPIVALREE